MTISFQGSNTAVPSNEKAPAPSSKAYGVDGDLEEEIHRREDAVLVPSRTVVFSSKAGYSTLVWVLLGFSVFITLVMVIPIWFDPDSTPEDKAIGIISILASTIFIIVIFALVLPTAFEVRSDASIGVKTLFFTYSFPDAVRAYRLEGLGDGLFRPRIKFATDLETRVCIRRRRHWDLIVSPKEADGFIRAVNDVSNQMEG